ncbi:flippase [Thermotoga sp. RQ7]|uniref:flippase n=1 Tax=Thermotoga sp. RQ7 TaxID=126738 RepID=UPI0005A481A0|nr:flippase [Thermotoga sp. RQ7]
METKYERYLKVTVKQAGMIFSTRVIGYLLGFALQVMFARFLGADLYGLYALGLTVTNVGVLFSVLGMSSGAVRFLGEYLGKQEFGKVKALLKIIFSTSVLISIASSVLLVVFRKQLASVFNEPRLEGILLWFSFVLALYTIMNVLVGVFQGFKKPALFTFYKEVLERILRMAVFGVLYLLGLKLTGAVLATVVSTAVVVGFLLFNLRKILRPIQDVQNDSINAREFFSYSLSMLFVGFTYFLMGQVNQLILGIFSDSRSVGLYAVSNTVSQLLVFFLGSFNMIFAPIISELYHTNQRETLSNMYSNLTRWIVSLTVPLFLWIITFPEEILSIFGKDYTQAKNALILLSVGQLVNAAVGSNGLLLSMTKYQKYEMLNGILVASLNIVLNILLVPRYGVLGSAVGGSLAIATVNIIKMIEVYLALRMFPYNLRYIKPIVSGAAVWIVLMLLKQFSQGITLLLLGLVSSFAVMFLGLVLLGLFEEDKVILKSVLGRVKR